MQAQLTWFYRRALSFLRPVKFSFLQLVRDAEIWTRQNPRVVGGIGAGLVVLCLLLWWYIRSRRPTAEELERRRREFLANTGRITDGFILDARTLSGEESTSPTPEVLFYSYSHAGVTYNCAQDVSLLPELVRGYRLDQSVQVRYDPRNPGNSVLVSESWSGLWHSETKGRSRRSG